MDYASSSMSATENRCNVVSYALRVAAFASGIGFAGYHKPFGCHLRMSVTSGTMFHRLIEEVYPHIIEMLEYLNGMVYIHLLGCTPYTTVLET